MPRGGGGRLVVVVVVVVVVIFIVVAIKCMWVLLAVRSNNHDSNGYVSSAFVDYFAYGFNV